MAKRILLIIENANISRPIAAFLREVDYQIKICDDAKMAISAVKNIKPDLIICDDNMPQISGKELARLFKSHITLSKIPFLLITTRMPSLNDMEHAGFRVEADDFIQLPLKQAELYGLVTKWLEGDAPPKTISEKLSGPLSDYKLPKPAKPWNKDLCNPSSLARLFFHLIRTEESGVLRVKGERRSLQVLIKSGSVVDVFSNYIRDDTLGKYLMSINKITSKQNEESLKIAMSKNIPQGKVLVDMKAIEEQMLDYYVTQQKMAKVSNLFSSQWQNAAFEFSAERIGTKSVEMAPFPLRNILLSSILEVADPQEIFATFARNQKDDAGLHRTPYLEKILDLMDLGSDQMNLVKQVENKSINQVRAEKGEHFELYLRMIFLFIVAKGLRFGEKAKPIELPPPPPHVKKDDVIEPTTDSKFPVWDLKAYNQELTESQTYFNHEDFRNSIPHLKKMLEINPESTQAMAMLAWANFQLYGRDNIAVMFESKEMLKKAISLDDSCDLALLFLGKILKHEGKDSLAGSYFKRAYEANQANDEARREVKLMQIKRRKARDLGFRH